MTCTCESVMERILKRREEQLKTFEFQGFINYEWERALSQEYWDALYRHSSYRCGRRYESIEIPGSTEILLKIKNEGE